MIVVEWEVGVAGECCRSFVTAAARKSSTAFLSSYTGVGGGASSILASADSKKPLSPGESVGVAS